MAVIKLNELKAQIDSVTQGIRKEPTTGDTSIVADPGKGIGIYDGNNNIQFAIRHDGSGVSLSEGVVFNGVDNVINPSSTFNQHRIATIDAILDYVNHQQSGIIKNYDFYNKAAFDAFTFDETNTPALAFIMDNRSQEQIDNGELAFWEFIFITNTYAVNTFRSLIDGKNATTMSADQIKYILNNANEYTVSGLDLGKLANLPQDTIQQIDHLLGMINAKLDSTIATQPTGHTLYLDTENMSGNGNGSVLNPFKTLELALQNLEDHKDLLIRAGSYAESSLYSYTGRDGIGFVGLGHVDIDMTTRFTNCGDIKFSNLNLVNQVNPTPIELVDCTDSILRDIKLSGNIKIDKLKNSCFVIDSDITGKIEVTGYSTTTHKTLVISNQRSLDFELVLNDTNVVVVLVNSFCKSISSINSNNDTNILYVRNVYASNGVPPQITGDNLYIDDGINRSIIEGSHFVEEYPVSPSGIINYVNSKLGGDVEKDKYYDTPHLYWDGFMAAVPQTIKDRFNYVGGASYDGYYESSLKYKKSNGVVVNNTSSINDYPASRAEISLPVIADRDNTVFFKLPLSGSSWYGINVCLFDALGSWKAVLGGVAGSVAATTANKALYMGPYHQFGKDDQYMEWASITIPKQLVNECMVNGEIKLSLNVPASGFHSQVQIYGLAVVASHAAPITKPAIMLYNSGHGGARFTTWNNSQLQGRSLVTVDTIDYPNVRLPISDVNRGLLIGLIQYNGESYTDRSTPKIRLNDGSIIYGNRINNEKSLYAKSFKDIYGNVDCIELTPAQVAANVVQYKGMNYIEFDLINYNTNFYIYMNGMFTEVI